MKTLLTLLLACGACAVQARPLVIQEKSSFSNPDPSYESFGGSVAIDGDHAMVKLRHYTPPQGEFDTGEAEDLAVWWFRRVNDVWTPVRQVDTAHHSEFYIWDGDLAMQNGVAALALNPIRIFEKRNGDWVRATFNDAEPDMPGEFTFTRFGTTNTPVQVFFTISGTAGNGSDYATISNSFTIPALKVFSIP